MTRLNRKSSSLSSMGSKHADPIKTSEQSGGSHDRRCALREPDTHADQRCEDCDCKRVRPPVQSDARLRYLEQAVGAAKITLMQEMGVLDSVLDVLRDSALIMTTEEDPSVMSLEDFVETDILLTLDSGCCDHIVDMADAPGYAAVLHPSPGSQRNQKFVVGNGDRVANQGQVKLRMKAKD